MTKFVVAWLLYQACYPNTNVCYYNTVEIPFTADGRVTDYWCESLAKDYIYSFSKKYTPTLDVLPGSIICGEIYHAKVKEDGPISGGSEADS